MIFKELKINNFKSFKGTHEFSFKRKNGLHFLVGDNKVDSEIESNGSGKSTLWDAIYWVLYGKTLRNLRADNLRTWKETGPCYGELAIDDYTICRQWNPNKLYLKEGDGQKDIDQETLDELIGLNPEAFKYSIIFGQFSEMFFDLKAAQKLTLFSEILDLQSWVDNSDRASSRSSEIETALSNKEQSLAKLKSMIKEIAIDINTLKEKNKLHQKEIEKEKESLKETRRGVRVAIKTRIEALTDLQEGLEKAQKKLKKCKATKTNTQNDLKQAQDYCSEQREASNILTFQYKAKKEELSKISSVKGFCTHCNQEVPKEHREKELKKIKKVCAELEEARTEVDDSLEKAHKKLSQIRSSEDSIAREIKGLNNSVKGYEREVYESQSFISHQEKQIETLKDSITKVGEKESPYLTLIKEKRESRKSTKERKETQEAKVEKLRKELAAAKYWVKGFKEIRLGLIEEALIALEVEVNNNLRQLGLTNWSVTFDIEKENKTGGITKGFTVLIHSPHNNNPVPWEAWSGGESQRLRLAGTMGLANLILNKKGITSNIEVYDEPSAHMSSAGVDSLVELLYQRAKDVKKQIWLVEHTSHDFGNFESTTCIRKTSKGSRIIKG